MLINNLRLQGNIDILDLVYPIGSLYVNVNNIDPSAVLGGTWDRYAEGRVLVGVNESDADFATAGKTLGHKKLQAHTHNIGITEAGTHAHSASSGSAGGHNHSASTTISAAGDHTHYLAMRISASALAGWFAEPPLVNNSGERWMSNPSNNPIQWSGDHTHSASTSVGWGGDHAHTVSVGNGGSHTHAASATSTGGGNSENLQPSITVYMWVRTA